MTKEKCSEYNRRWYQKNKRENADRVRRWFEKNPIKRRILTWRAHGLQITIEEYEYLLTAQKGCCRICNVKLTFEKKQCATRLCIDHDHTTGKTRALLCRNCNVALGLLKDDPSLFHQAANYLESFI